jgi:PPOX class probable F420-dependent enzyme
MSGSSDGDEALFSTTKQRQKGRILARNPRVSIVVVDPDDPYNFAEIRGRAALTDDPDNALGNALTQEYLGTDAGPDAPGAERVVVRVTPDKVIGPAPHR